MIKPIHFFRFFTLERLEVFYDLYDCWPLFINLLNQFDGRWWDFRLVKVFLAPYHVAIAWLEGQIWFLAILSYTLSLTSLFLVICTGSVVFIELCEQIYQKLAKLCHHFVATKHVICLIDVLLELEIECNPLTVFSLAVFFARSMSQYTKNVENFI